MARKFSTASRKFWVTSYHAALSGIGCKRLIRRGFWHRPPW